jgi:hypothetical protein
MRYDLFFVFGFIFIIIYFIIVYFRKQKNKNIIERETLNYNNTEIMFFENIKNGKIPYKILNIYTPFDLMMIKSLFISEDIPYYVEFEHIMKIQPFIHGLNYNNVNLYILENDYDDAINVIINYINTKISTKYNIKNVFRNIIEMLLFFRVVSSPSDYLGIDIYYKNDTG